MTVKENGEQMTTIRGSRDEAVGSTHEFTKKLADGDEETHFIHRVFLEEWGGDDTLTITGEAGAYVASATLRIGDGVHCVSIVFDLAGYDYTGENPDHSLVGCIEKINRMQNALDLLRQWLPKCQAHHEKARKAADEEREERRAELDTALLNGGYVEVDGGDEE